MSLKTFIRTTLSLVLPFTANASTVEQMVNILKSEPYQTATLGEAENKALFSKYRIGDATSPQSPQPNYADPLVRKAAERLSAAQSQASVRLVQVAKKEFNGLVEQAKETAKQIAQLPDPATAEIAQKLVAEIGSANPEKGFSPESKELVGKLTSMLTTSLTQASEPLMQSLPTELKGVDFDKLAAAVKALGEMMRAEFKPVDFKLISTIADDLATSLASELAALDAAAVLQAATTLETMINPASNGGKYLKSQITNLKAYFEKNPVQKPEDVLIYVSEVSYAIQYAKQTNGLTLTAEGEKAVQVIKKQYFNSQGKSILKQVDDLKKNLAKQQAAPSPDADDQVRYAASSISSMLEENKANLSAATVSKLNLLAAEVSKFTAAEVTERIAKLEKSLASPNKSDAVYSAQSLVYDLKQLAEKNDSVKPLLAQLESETSKGSTQQVLKSAEDLKKQLEISKGELTDELANAFSNFKYSLDDVKAALTPESAQKYALISKLSDQIYSMSSLKTTVSTVAPKDKKAEHFYFYSAIARMYKDVKMAPEAPEGTQPEAHTFLTNLCGEFRDRATMIEAKVKWAGNIFILPVTTYKTFTIDPKKNVWSQVPASSYYPFLQLSGQVWEAKREAQERYITIGSETQIDNPVPGFTVCETKYMMSEYVGKTKPFDNAKSYYEGYKTYRESCPLADRQDYYNFRGDSNFKHYSPESNGMIWYATSLARACKSPTEVRPNQIGYTDEDCKKYFTKPFFYRYNAARAGLATWLFRDDRHADKFAAQGQQVAIYPHTSPELAPLSFSFDQKQTDSVFEFDSKWLALQKAWNSPDIGFNALLGLGTPNADKFTAYRRLQDAVDRHTDWYHSGFNDKNGTVKDQAYSPFVASSYEMSESDNFTQCGTTVKCPPDGLKRWMFVFRIKPENTYNTASVVNNQPLDFDKVWLDETSFGKSHLADSEKAWDRLGTAMEDELDSVLYLINVNRGEGEGEGEGGIGEGEHEGH